MLDPSAMFDAVLSLLDDIFFWVLVIATFLISLFGFTVLVVVPCGSPRMIATLSAFTDWVCCLPRREEGYLDVDWEDVYQQEQARERRQQRRQQQRSRPPNQQPPPEESPLLPTRVDVAGVAVMPTLTSIAGTGDPASDSHTPPPAYSPTVSTSSTVVGSTRTSLDDVNPSTIVPLHTSAPTLPPSLLTITLATHPPSYTPLVATTDHNNNPRRQGMDLNDIGAHQQNTSMAFDTPAGSTANTSDISRNISPSVSDWGSEVSSSEDAVPLTSASSEAASVHSMANDIFTTTMAGGPGLARYG